MITDPTKLPKLVECDGCKYTFTSYSFLWHDCSADPDSGDSVNTDEDDESDEEDVDTPWAEDDRDATKELAEDNTPEVTVRYVRDQPTRVSLPEPLIDEPIERLPFKFLASEHANVVEELRNHIRRTCPGGSHRREIDWARFYSLQKKLNASVLALGEKGWWGYAVFKIPGNDRFVLDSVVTNNAAYVIEGDWRKAIHYSKAEIRAEYRQFHKRIVHTTDWIGRIQDALRERSFRPPSDRRKR